MSEKKPTDPQILTRGDLADRWEVTRATIRRYAHLGRLPEPNGRIGCEDYWLLATVKTYERKRRPRGGVGGRPRKTAEETLSA